MPWLRIDESFSQHPKVIDLSDAAFRLHVAALCHCSRNLTDGFVSENAARLCYPKPAKLLVTELVRSRLWERAAGGYMIHDYLAYNPHSSQVRAQRQKAKDRMTYVRANITRTDDARSPEPSPSPYPVPVLGTFRSYGAVAEATVTREKRGTGTTRMGA